MTTLSREELRELAARMAEAINQARAERPKLALVKTAKASQFDAITREAYLRRIRFLSKFCGLYWLVDQACFHVANVDGLEDAELAELLNEMERARECIREGIPLEDAELLRNPLRRIRC